MVQVCGHSSAVERHVANVTVEGSIPFARSIFFVFFRGARCLAGFSGLGFSASLSLA